MTIINCQDNCIKVAGMKRQKAFFIGSLSFLLHKMPTPFYSSLLCPSEYPPGGTAHYIIMCLSHPSHTHPSHPLSLAVKITRNISRCWLLGWRISLMPRPHLIHTEALLKSTNTHTNTHCQIYSYTHTTTGGWQLNIPYCHSQRWKRVQKYSTQVKVPLHYWKFYLNTSKSTSLKIYSSKSKK